MPTPKPPAANLALIGGRGCGKSSIARRVLARDKRFTLWSLDAVISLEAGGKKIPEIVEEQGWHAFRDIEAEVVERLTAFEDWQLLDCGGGIVVDLDDDGNEIFSERKVDALRDNALVIYLKRDLAFLEDRIRNDRNRPDLSITASFAEIMERRDPWYRTAAHTVIKASGMRKNEILDAVLEAFYAHTGVRPLSQE
ncbi:MAG: shikimate kinase [bacterium]